MSDIFISYSRKDESFVSRLVADLEREGRDVFYDRKLKAGENYEQVLTRELEGSEFVVIVLSPNSLAPSSQVHSELKAALELERKHRTTVIPLLIAASDPDEINKLIGKKYYANFTVAYHTGFLELSATLAGSKLKRKGRSWSMGWRETGIGAAIITGIVTLVTAYWQFVYKPAHLDQPPATIQYAGRVTDASSSNQRAIPKAKVSVDTQGVPQLYYSDSEGIFYVQLPSSSQSAHLRVEADGYETYDRIVSLSRTGVEIVPLKPLPTPTNQNSPTRPKSGNKHKDDRINRILSSEPSNRPG